MELFQIKVLRGVLKLSQHSPMHALHFLLGELPVEGVLVFFKLDIYGAVHKLRHLFWTLPDPYLPLCHLVSSFDILPPTPYQMT